MLNGLPESLDHHPGGRASLHAPRHHRSADRKPRDCFLRVIDLRPRRDINKPNRDGGGGQIMTSSWSRGSRWCRDSFIPTSANGLSWWMTAIFRDLRQIIEQRSTELSHSVHRTTVSQAMGYRTANYRKNTNRPTGYPTTIFWTMAY